MIFSKPYTEETAADFRRLFEDRFPDGDSGILDVVLANPLRKTHPDSGAIAYSEGGTVIGIFGLLPRRVFCRQEQILVACAEAMAVKKDVDRSFFSDFLEKAIRDSGADLFIANTVIPGSRKRLKAAAGVVDGPSSCTEIREREVRSSGLAARVVRKALSKLGLLGELRELPLADEDVMTVGGHVLARECALEDRAFDDFWSHYLMGNRGLVSSRTADELRWMFAKDLARGEVVLLTARKGGALQGYVFCRRTDETARCWRVVDWIALGNDEATLEKLVEAAGAFLRRHTPATCLQITGFPMWVQPLLRRLFPKSSPFGYNKCVWAFLDDRAKDMCGDWVNAANGWYGGPYDGDMCLI